MVYYGFERSVKGDLGTSLARDFDDDSPISVQDDDPIYPGHDADNLAQARV